ncbi:MAG: ATP-binding cassette domain-containing protein [Oligoflexia bacterium]|nr:ATP-binding cassette domain-containing protein [Oligoflexia bacterium]
MIELKSVKKSYGDKVVIPNLDFKVLNGKTHCLLGSSGSGKTTILRIISGLTQVDQGEVIIQGTPLSNLSTQEFASKVGYISQEGGLFPHITCWDNILLPGKVHGRNIDELKKKTIEFCKMVDLQISLLDKVPSQLSGGQRQRVALIRGLILDPEILLLDEPMSALDPLVRASLQKQLKVLFKELAKTVLLITHDLHEASYLGDVIHLLNQGRVIQEGQFNDLYKNPKEEFVKEFLQAQIPLDLMGDAHV